MQTTTRQRRRNARRIPAAAAKRAAAKKAWQARAAQETRDREAVMRDFSNGLKFTQLCGDRRCKRAGKCAGDVNACFWRCWRHVPQDFKNTLQMALKLRIDGLSPADAIAGARAEVERRKAALARYEAGPVAAEPVVPARIAPPPRPPAPMRGPRIRQL